jgi:uncharacterized integral membrane protein
MKPTLHNLAADAVAFLSSRMPRHWPVTILGILLTVALVVLGLYGFGHAPLLAAPREGSRPEVITMALRAGAVAVIAAAQVVLLFTLWRVSAPRAFDWALAIALLLLTGVAIACSVALARTGR